MSPSIWQLAIVLVIVLLLFGTKKLRNLGGDLGSAIKSFRSAVKDGGDASKATHEGEADETAQLGQGGGSTANDENKQRDHA